MYSRDTQMILNNNSLALELGTIATELWSQCLEEVVRLEPFHRNCVTRMGQLPRREL